MSRPAPLRRPLHRLDQTTKTTVKVAALADYFREAPEADRLWTVALLSGRRPRRTVTATDLRDLGGRARGLPLWLFEEAYPVVGDLAETIALVLPPPRHRLRPPLAHWIDEIRGLARLDPPSAARPPSSPPGTRSTSRNASSSTSSSPAASAWASARS
jgi:hypothetical protein